MKWISIKQRLPETNGWYLVFNEHDGILFARYRKDTEESRGGFHDIGGWINGIKLWSELPTHEQEYIASPFGD